MMKQPNSKLQASTHSYIARAACGCVVGMCLDWGNRQFVAKAVAEFIAAGLSIERVPSDVVRQLPTIGCTCPKPEQEALPL